MLQCWFVACFRRTKVKTLITSLSNLSALCLLFLLIHRSLASNFNQLGWYLFQWLVLDANSPKGEKNCKLIIFKMS